MRSVFERDRARVLHSSALRRLAAKTQVVGPGEDDFPRTRLTHSLECAQIGRELGAALGADADLVDAACLAHDLGHPPFGHNGEAALDEAAAACGGFEGNAQSLRELTRLEVKVLDGDTSAGLNLTRATLDATLKYPWPRRAGTRKFGVYPDDRPVFDWVREGTPPGFEERRCLEAQVMDWADDVAYSVHDLEDAVYAGLVDLAVLDDQGRRKELVALAGERYAPVDDDAFDRLCDVRHWVRGPVGSPAGLAELKAMTSELIGRFCAAALRASRAAAVQAGLDVDGGPAGSGTAGSGTAGSGTAGSGTPGSGGPLCRYGADLVVPAETTAECAALKAVTAHFVMDRPGVSARRLRQRELIGELVGLLAGRAPGALDPVLRPAWAAAPDDAARLRVVVDQVARLTDTSAVRRHAQLAGRRTAGTTEGMHATLGD